MRYLVFFTLFSLFSFSQTVVEKVDEKWLLKVDGEPFVIKGVTFGYDSDVDNYDQYFEELKFLGVNTIRTWATGSNTPQLLDAAERHNIKVMVGIWMRHGRPGMEDDDSFNYLTDEEGMKAMYTTAVETVESYKNHSAVLTWGVGNEVYLNTATDEEKLAYSKFLERVCRTIKFKDANHPVISVEAWTFGLEWWEKYVPSLDIYGLNSYGAAVHYLQAALDERNIDKPYIVTEFGITGEWDIKNERHGIKLEPSDTEKYNAVANGYKDWILNKPSCLGVYVFHYSSGNGHMAPWLLTHVGNLKRPQYWAIRKAYTGKNPVNNIPDIEAFELPDKSFKSSSWVPVDLKVFDVENDTLDISFSYNQRSGSRKRRDQILPLNYRGNSRDGFEIQIPKEDGALKIYANVKDAYSNLGIASTSILVNDKDARLKKYKVPKVKLPFYVYQDNNTHLPYTPSGYMGNYEDMEVDLNAKDDVHTGETAIKISYNTEGGWYGLALVDPANDWGKIIGGYDISGAQTFSFWAKSDFDVSASIGFGLIDIDKPFPDTAKKSIEIQITDEWKKFTIKIKKVDLSCIRSGLVLFSNGNGYPHKIYIDDVVFE